MSNYKYKDWEKAFSSIDCEYLKKKVAAIIWWDFVDRAENLSIFIRDYMNSYVWDTNPDKTTEEDLCQALNSIGYPMWYAKHRSKNPKAERRNYES